MHRFDSPRFFRPLISPQICISTQIQYFRWLARIIARGIATLGKGTTQKEVLRDNRTVDPQLFFTGFRIQPRQPLTTITNYGITGIDCTILGHQPSIKLRDIRLNDNMPSADNQLRQIPSRRIVTALLLYVTLDSHHAARFDNNLPATLNFSTGNRQVASLIHTTSHVAHRHRPRQISRVRKIGIRCSHGRHLVTEITKRGIGVLKRQIIILPCLNRPRSPCRRRRQACPRGRNNLSGCANGIFGPRPVQPRLPRHRLPPLWRIHTEQPASSRISVGEASRSNRILHLQSNHIITSP